MTKVLLLISAVLNIILGIWGFTLNPIEAVEFIAIFGGISLIIHSVLLIVFIIKASKAGAIDTNIKRALIFRVILTLMFAGFLLFYPGQTLRIIIVTLAILTIIESLTHIFSPKDSIEILVSILAIAFSLFLLFSLAFSIITLSVIFYMVMTVIIINGIRLAFLVLSGRTNLVD